jgi:hypothetical protein
VTPRHLTIFLARRTMAAPGLSITTQALFADYRQWCARFAIRPLGRQRFGKEVRPTWCPVTRTTTVYGLALLPDGETPPQDLRRGDFRMPILVLREGLTADDVVALSLVADELARVRSEEGYTGDYDDETHSDGCLAVAGGLYLIHASQVESNRKEFPTGVPRAPELWPFQAACWKPSSPIRDAVKGGCLGISEISLLLRRGEQPVGG